MPTFKCFPSLIVLLILTAAISGHAASSSGVLLLNNYFRDQVAKQVDLFLPRGKYTAQVEVTLDRAKIQAYLPRPCR